MTEIKEIDINLDSDIICALIKGDNNLHFFYDIEIKSLYSWCIGDIFSVTIAGTNDNLESFLLEMGFEAHVIREKLEDF